MYVFISRETQPNGNLYFPPFPAQSYTPDIHAATYKCALENPVGRIVSRESRIKAGTDLSKCLILFPLHSPAWVYTRIMCVYTYISTPRPKHAGMAVANPAVLIIVVILFTPPFRLNEKSQFAVTRVLAVWRLSTSHGSIHGVSFKMPIFIII